MQIEGAIFGTGEGGHVGFGLFLLLLLENCSVMSCRMDTRLLICSLCCLVVNLVIYLHFVLQLKQLFFLPGYYPPLTSLEITRAILLSFEVPY